MIFIYHHFISSLFPQFHEIKIVNKPLPSLASHHEYIQRLLSIKLGYFTRNQSLQIYSSISILCIYIYTR